MLSRCGKGGAQKTDFFCQDPYKHICFDEKVFRKNTSSGGPSGYTNQKKKKTKIRKKKKVKRL